MSELLSAETNSIKKCEGEKCSNTLPLNSQFPYCEVCRTLISRNSLTILLDPHSPHPTHTHLQRLHVHTQMLTALSGEEVIRLVQNLEDVYLNTKKHIMANKVETSTQRAKHTMGEEHHSAVSANRSMSPAEKTHKKYAKIKQSRAEKLTKLVGGNAEEAKRLMGETFEL